jgi:hypothetical protein
MHYSIMYHTKQSHSRTIHSKDCFILICIGYVIFVLIVKKHLNQNNVREMRCFA